MFALHAISINILWAGNYQARKSFLKGGGVGGIQSIFKSKQTKPNFDNHQNPNAYA